MPERSPTGHEVTRILQAVGRGDKQSADELLPLVYGELRRLADSRLARMRPGQTLQATALVHEAWLRVVGTEDPGWECREHFFRFAARAMRDILVEEARKKASIKRDARRADGVDPAELVVEENAGGDFLVLDAALSKLEALRPQLGELVSLRFFGGLTMNEVAEALGIPLRNAEREWAYARVWLRDEIAQGS